MCALDPILAAGPMLPQMVSQAVALAKTVAKVAMVALGATALMACESKLTPEQEAKIEAGPTLQRIGPYGDNGNYIIRDTETGCQYLRSSQGGTTPRMGPDGKQICDKGAQ